MTLTSQYEMLKTQTGPKTKEAALAKLRKSFGPLPILMKKVRAESTAVSNPVNFWAMKKFIEEDSNAILDTIDQTEAQEKKIAP